MKKRNLTSLKLNKEYISNLNLTKIKGGRENCESRIICEEPDTIGVCPTYNATFVTYCP